MLFSLYCLAAFSADDIDKDVVSLVLVGSSVYTLGGILLIHAGNKTKKKALSLSLNTTRLQLPPLAKLKGKMQASLSLSLSFR